MCDNNPWLFFRRTVSFLKREDQRMLVLNQLLVSVCARSIHSGISINLIGGQLATSLNSMDSAENSLQIDNNLILFIHSKYYIKTGLFRLSTCQGASPAHLPLIIFIEFSPHFGFCFLSPYADFLCFSVGFYLHWSFLISFLMRNSSAIWVFIVQLHLFSQFKYFILQKYLLLEIDTFKFGRTQ